MGDKQAYLFDALESGDVCVFPSEVSARGALIAYARRCGAIFSDRALSYDDFCKLFAQPGDRKQSTDTIRFLFLENALKEGSITLSYFIPQRGSETKRLVRYLSSLLPQLKLFHDQKGQFSIKREMAGDYEFLYLAYSRYLKERNLYEQLYESPAIPKEHGTYRILFPSTLPGFFRLYAQLGEPEWIIPLPFEGPEEKPTLSCYPNHVTEVRSTLRKIHTLLGEGVPARNILISTARAQVMMPLLEAEAARYDVPLVTHMSQNPILYPAGRIFQLFQSCYQNQMAYADVEALLLEPALPYEADVRNLSEQLLSFAIDQGIDQGDIQHKEDDLWLRELTPSLVQTAKKDPGIIDHYKRLKEMVVSLCEAHDGKTFLASFHAFQDCFFLSEGWKGGEDEDLATFCIDKINALDEEIRLSGCENNSSFLSLLIEYLKSKPYTWQKRDAKGVDVYRWTDSAALSVPYHFFLAMDWDGTKRIDRPLSCLPETLEAEKRMEEDLTDSYLDMAASDNPILSYHAVDYSGQCMAPAWFDLVKDVSAAKESDGSEVTDPWQEEMRLWREGVGRGGSCVMQAEAYEKAFRSGLLTPFKAPSQVSASALSLAKLGAVSASSLDRFHTCPFAFMSEHVLGAERSNYEIGVIDARVIGKIIHMTFEEFYGSPGSFPSFPTEDMAALCRKRMEACFEKALACYLGKGNPILLFWVREKYLPLCLEENEGEALYGLGQGIRNCFAGSATIATEKSFLYEQGKEIEVDGMPLKLVGIIDRVIRSANGELVVLDYKKNDGYLKLGRIGELEKKSEAEMAQKYTSVQLPLYDRILEGKVDVALYYSVEQSKFITVWAPDCHPQMKALGQSVLESRLEEYVAHLREGKWSFQEDPEECKDCGYRSVCRRRYSTL